MTARNGVRRLLDRFSSPLGRIGLGIIALGTIALGLLPTAGATFDPEKSFAAAVAVVAWLFSEVTSAVRHPAERSNQLGSHDLDLGTRLRSIATDDFMRFLDEHDFGGSFRDAEALRIHDLADFSRYASSEFDDPTLQAAWLLASKECAELSRLIAYGSAPRNSRGTLYTLIPSDEPDGLWSKETEAKVTRVNNKADDLSSRLMEIFRLLRRGGLVLGGREVAVSTLLREETQE